METLHTWGTILGIGLLSGFRLYATVLALGLGMRFGWLDPGAQYQDLTVLGETKVLVLAGVACAVEFLADKVAWVDSLWDGFHTLIRPIGAALLATTALGEISPVNKALIALLCGGIAFASHTSKAATRLLVNHSPEPFSNVAVSAFEDVVVAAGVWFVFAHPMATLVILGSFLAVFCWLSPRLFRLMRVELAAVRGLLQRWFATGVAPRAEFPGAVSEPVQRLWEAMRDRLQEVPISAAREVRDELAVEAPTVGVYCAATKTIPGMRNSIGYLCLAGDQQPRLPLPPRAEAAALMTGMNGDIPFSGELVFVGKRWFGWRVHSVRLADVRDVRWKGRLLLDHLWITTSTGQVRFNVFKLATATKRGVGLEDQTAAEGI
jgi:hypothetical protein